jgi:hypothetical protein
VVKALVTGQIPKIRDECNWISSTWENIINIATAANRADRFASALELQIAMEEAMVEFGGTVPQRELATFMDIEFGAWRAERKCLVDAEIRKPIVALTSVLQTTNSALDLARATPAPAAASELPGSSSSSSTEQRNRRFLPGLVLALVLVVAAGMVWLRGQTDARTHTQPAGSQSKHRVMLAIDTVPSAAEVRVAGELIGRTPLAKVFDSSGARTDIVVSAAGYEDHRESVALISDLSLSFALNPSHSETKAPEPPRSADMHVVSRKRPFSPAGAPPVVRPRAAESAAPKGDCIPPYKLDDLGVRTYKPECL